MEGLRQAGHDVTHVRDAGLAAADDSTVVTLAQDERRVLVWVDTDFGTLLAGSRDTAPSVILFRRETGRRPTEQLQLRLANLDQLAGALDAGCIVVLTDRLIRIRQLRFCRSRCAGLPHRRDR